MNRSEGAARRCLVCGSPLHDRAGRPGRPAAWCSKACRQAAYRARKAAERAAERAAHIRGQLGDAHAELHRAEGQMATAYGRALDQAAEPGAAPTDHLTGGHRWETAVEQAAAALRRAAHRLGDLAAEHDRARADYAAAMRTFRHPPAAEALGDETASAAEPAAEAVAVSDMDALFEAAEDVITAHISGTLPAEMAAAWRPQLDRLEAAWQDASGDDPGPLAAAAAALVSLLPASALAPHGEAPDVLARLAAALR
jgi:hypothetical protein